MAPNQPQDVQSVEPDSRREDLAFPALELVSNDLGRTAQAVIVKRALKSRSSRRVYWLTRALRPVIDTEVLKASLVRVVSPDIRRAACPRLTATTSRHARRRSPLLGAYPDRAPPSSWRPEVFAPIHEDIDRSIEKDAPSAAT